MKQRISIIIPAHNEEENLPILIPRLQKMIRKNKLNAEIIIVDDNSTDSTPVLCDRFSKKYKNIKTIHRKSNPGMGFALREGTKASKGDIIIWTMADLTDDLKTIPKFIEKIKSGADMVFGSRYMKGGSAGDLSLLKRFVSWGFTFASRTFIGIKVHDITNAFRAFRKEVFFAVEPEAGDFAISPEFALKAHLKGFILSEVPTVYKDRKKGTTKFKMFLMSKRYFWVFFWLSLKNSDQSRIDIFDFFIQSTPPISFCNGFSVFSYFI